MKVTETARPGACQIRRAVDLGAGPDTAGPAVRAPDADRRWNAPQARMLSPYQAREELREHPEVMRRMLKRWPWLAGYLPKPRACVWIHPAYRCGPWRIQCAYCDRRRPQIGRGCARTPCCDGPDRTCHHEYDAWRPGNYWRPSPDGACMRCGAPTPGGRCGRRRWTIQAHARLAMMRPERRRRPEPIYRDAA